MSKTKRTIPLDINFADGTSETIKVKEWIPQSWTRHAIGGKSVKNVQDVTIEASTVFGRVKIHMRPDLEEELVPVYEPDKYGHLYSAGPSQIRYISGGLGCDCEFTPSELGRISERFLAVVEFAKLRNFELHHKVKSSKEE